MRKLTRVLLVDDSEATNFLHTSLLQEIDFAEEVLVARNGAEGLALFEGSVTQNKPPELVLLDLKMPVMDGFDFLVAYKDHHYNQQYKTVIVVLTSSSDPRDVRQLQDIGLAHYLPKPLTVADLQALAAFCYAKQQQ